MKARLPQGEYKVGMYRIVFSFYPIGNWVYYLCWFCFKYFCFKLSVILLFYVVRLLDWILQRNAYKGAYGQCCRIGAPMTHLYSWKKPVKVWCIITHPKSCFKNPLKCLYWILWLSRNHRNHMEVFFSVFVFPKNLLYFSCFLCVFLISQTSNMEGYSRILSLLLPIFLHLASAWQKPNMEYLSSLKGKYQNLLQTLACENFDDSTEISNCATYMLHGKYKLWVCVWRVWGLP